MEGDASGSHGCNPPDALDIVIFFSGKQSLAAGTSQQHTYSSTRNVETFFKKYEYCVPHRSKEKVPNFRGTRRRSLLKMLRHHECGGKVQRQQRQRPTANRKRAHWLRLRRKQASSRRKNLEWQEGEISSPFLMSQYYSTIFGIRVR